MHRIRVYIDTSVFGGTQDKEFSVESCRFFEHAQKGGFIILLSAETMRELSKSPKTVQEVWEGLLPEFVEEVDINPEVVELAEEYVRSNVLKKTSLSDALHVAAATVANADLILSWNFKHIVNFNRIRGFNSVNIRLGYRSITILSPKEIVDESEE
jgi:predicted nucleic acid-binding protein